MFKLLFLYFLLVVSSPFIVAYDTSVYTVSGWMAIGNYDFNLVDGLRRSILFFLVTFPVISSLYLGAPRGIFSNDYSRFYLSKSRFTLPAVYFFIFLSIYSLVYDLGINGVETVTTFKLSGIAYYLRSYISVIFISIYIFQRPKPSFLFICIYSLIVGYSSVSRFTGVTPLFLLFIRELIDSNGKFLYRHLLISLAILILFSLITYIRLFFYVDGYTFSKTLDFVDIAIYSDSSFFYQGLNQLFLRIGIGRDVILSYEVAQSKTCTDVYGLFFGTSSCPNPPLDFYGLELDSNRFYTAPPQLSGLFILSENLFFQFFYSLLYSFLLYFILLFSKRLCRFPYGDVIYIAVYFFILIFALIGPALYIYYLLFFLLFISVFFKIFSRNHVIS